jgi:hypothetical protein
MLKFSGGTHFDNHNLNIVNPKTITNLLALVVIGPHMPMFPFSRFTRKTMHQSFTINVLLGQNFNVNRRRGSSHLEFFFTTKLIN